MQKYRKNVNGMSAIDQVNQVVAENWTVDVQALLFVFSCAMMPL